MRGKRALDLLISLAGLVVLSPVLAVVTAVIWLGDRGNPIYAAPRVGRNGRPFTMLKFRTMVLEAESNGGSSTSTTDPRITPVGRILRPLKVDELPQLFNVLRGDMSIVGPRPNVQWATLTYSEEERELLVAKPGITDLASVVFADEGEILAGSDDPDLLYERIIRPYKGELGILYARKASVGVDLRVIWLTVVGLVSRARCLRGTASLVHKLGAAPSLVGVSRREQALSPSPPPGWRQVVEYVGEMPPAH